MKIKKGDMVKINRDKISNVFASFLPRDLFYNYVEVVNVDKKDERVEVKFGENTYWFDFDELKN